MAKKIINMIKKMVKVSKKKEYKKINIKGKTFVKATIKGNSHKQKATSDMLMSADLAVMPYREVTIDMIKERKIISYQIRDINNIKDLLKYCSIERQITDEELNDFQEWSKFNNMGMNAHMYEGELVLFY